MTETNATLGITLLESYRRLLGAVAELSRAVHEERRLPVWVALSDEERRQDLAPRAKAAGLYQALWYQDGQEGRETLTCPGIVGADADTLDLARDCNAAKDAFKAAVLALKTLPRPQANLLMEDLHQRAEPVATAMRRMGAARLNLKQAYRHTPLLERRPDKIGFTWSNQGRTIQRTTVAEARRLLERRAETPEVNQALARLNQVPETEILARVRSVCPHLRANLLYAGSGQRRLMQAPLPIMIPLQAGEGLPEFVPVGVEPSGQQRLRRSDVRIEDEPFLPLIRVHRYLMPYRTGSAEVGQV